MPVIRRVIGSAQARLPMILPERLRPKTKAGKAGMIAGGVVAGLIAVDLLALVVTAVVATTVGSR